MAFPGEIGWIGKNCPSHPAIKLHAVILRSGAGYFIGTQCSECRLMDPSPNSRESHYYNDYEELFNAMMEGKVKWRDTMFHPDKEAMIQEFRKIGQ